MNNAWVQQQGLTPTLVEHGTSTTTSADCGTDSSLLVVEAASERYRALHCAALPCASHEIQLRLGANSYHNERRRHFGASDEQVQVRGQRSSFAHLVQPGEPVIKINSSRSRSGELSRQLLGQEHFAPRHVEGRR